MQLPTITYLTDIWFAPGVARELPDILARFNVRRPLLVTDRGIVAGGIVERVNLPDSILFDSVESNPDESSVNAGVERYRAEKCDGVVALGGGSPIDCAKCVALMVTHAPPLRQYAFVEGGLAKITADKPPLIAVPTTAGTGSEVGRGALATFADGAKLAMISPKLIPQAAVCDPELTIGMPAWLTAATGMDAISHCVETYCSPRFNPVADAIALDGLGRACRNLLRAIERPDDLAARGEMLMAAMMGGLTFQKGLGAIHAISHPLGGLKDVRLHHGTLNSVLLPHVLRFNAAACPAKIETMAHVVGCGSARDLSFYFEHLARAGGLPAQLRDMGVTLEQCLSVLDGVMRDHCGATNPRKLGREDAECLLHSAWGAPPPAKSQWRDGADGKSDWMEDA
jgi:4-hydroxybutyrate dehydrogenase